MATQAELAILQALAANVDRNRIIDEGERLLAAMREQAMRDRPKVDAFFDSILSNPGIIQQRSK